jgi:hypothetical protein
MVNVHAGLTSEFQLSIYVAIFLLGSRTVPKIWYAIGFFTSIYQHDQAKAGSFINGFNLSTSGKSPTFH